MPEKAQPTKPLRVSEEVHAAVKRAAAELGMSMQDVSELAIKRGMPKQPGWNPQWGNNAPAR
jgi:hypothetical protein